jgi:hypothetical protein
LVTLVIQARIGCDSGAYHLKPFHPGRILIAGLLRLRSGARHHPMDADTVETPEL